jgi:hypothetical protein
MLLTDVATVDDVLRTHAARLGRDYTAYRHHVYRVVNLCAELSSRESSVVEKIAVAAVFHDLGIWTHGTFDYLPPSIALARAHLARLDLFDWATEIETMILEHHKVTAYRARSASLVEPFRRADWIDVTHGLRTFGIRRPFLREVFSAWPDAGFHWRLVTLSLARLRSHPLSPLPMMRL